MTGTVDGAVARHLPPLPRPTSTPTPVAELHELYQPRVTVEDAFPIVGDQLDLDRWSARRCSSSCPWPPLCRPDCAGLCPVCGIDRNAEQCGCDADPGR